jgi:predicted ATPase
MTRRIVITGGPGAGKTAVLEVLRKSTPRHVAFVQEAASILYGGGFPRSSDVVVRSAAQRAIFHVQRELEAIASGTVIVCDRGTLDGLAYWPGEEDDFFRELSIDRREELARYEAILHLRTPGNGNGYGHQNPLRIETPEEARAIDEKIAHAWRDHPRRWFLEATPRFLDKALAASAVIDALL